MHVCLSKCVSRCVCLSMCVRKCVGVSGPGRGPGRPKVPNAPPGCGMIRRPSVSAFEIY